MKYHTPVLLKESIDFLRIRQNSWYVDCNLGGGGHTDAIISRGGKVLGLDMDSDAVRESAKKFGLEVENKNGYYCAETDKLILYQTNFTEIKKVAESFGIRKVAGVLFDLGVSSHQLDTPERGFSFNTTAPLDMRMDFDHQKITAANLVNVLHFSELENLFWEYGGERMARKIAKKIVSARKFGEINTTKKLADIIISVRPRTGKDRMHPATRVFQALRMAVNGEQDNLRRALPEAFKILEPGGRMVILSFHSLEDRIVKDFFKEAKETNSAKILTPKPVKPTLDEQKLNPRSHSGRLRAFEKIK